MNMHSLWTKLADIAKRGLTRFSVGSLPFPPYAWIRGLLFSLPPETAHAWALRALNVLPCRQTLPSDPVQLWGLTFPNRLGIAAGLDKNGEYLDGLAKLGVGHIEIGTVTPRPQVGNPKPRLFRLVRERALINRMGFNNHGIDALLARVRRRRYRGILGINLGKNADTPLESALSDYLIGMDKAYSHADYLTVNISSPNTPGLRQLQQGDFLETLLSGLTERQRTLAKTTGRRVPLVVKISPDLADDALIALAESCLKHGIDGIIATNTTLSRDGVTSTETGGLSGRPLTNKSTETLRKLACHLQGRIPLIASGGVMNAQDIQDKLAAGAVLVQVYTGLVYLGCVWLEGEG